jgi:hypothetical protein
VVAGFAPLPKRAGGSYNIHVKLNTTKRMYVFVGVLGVLVGTAYLFERHYLFGAIYTLFGAIWLMMSRKNPGEKAARRPGGMALESPPGPADSRASTAENISKSAQS